MKGFFKRHPRVKMLLIVGVVLLVFVFLTLNFWKARLVGITALVVTNDSPVIDLVPKTKTFTGTDVPLGRDFLYKDIILSSPWADVIKVRGEDLLAVNFGEKSDRTIFVIESLEFYDNFEHEDYKKTRELFGSKTQSNFEYEEAALGTTRSSISLMSGSSDIRRDSILLIWKNVTVPRSTEDIKVFENQHGVRGFEYVMATSSMVSFYTPDDQNYNLYVAGASSNEIDFIIQSLRVY